MYDGDVNNEIMFHRDVQLAKSVPTRPGETSVSSDAPVILPVSHNGFRQILLLLHGQAYLRLTSFGPAGVVIFPSMHSCKFVE